MSYAKLEINSRYFIKYQIWEFFPNKKANYKEFCDTHYYVGY
jgi:hypothetical protein